MKILKIFLFLFLVFKLCLVNASGTPVEKVFKDIDKNYTYYNELQLLYDRGIILPDDNGNFNPNGKLTRDEFVGIVSEVSCKECIQPNVDFSYVQEYSNRDIFYDISKNDKYFYCIAEAENSGQVTGYDSGTSCSNGVQRDGEKPFCPKNNIILEEALAIILRASNILDIREAEIIRNEIRLGKNYPTLSGNIFPKLSNGAVYSFYPDFLRASQYVFTDYDKDGNEKKLKLLDFTKNINTKDFITREDFLRISYITLKNNSCLNSKENKFGLKIDVLDKVCSSEQENCKRSDFPLYEKIFDFKKNVGKLVDNDFTYIWRFYDYKTGKEVIRNGKYIDNYDFINSGKYRVYLTGKSPNGDTSEVYTDIKILDRNPIKNETENNKLLTSYIVVDKLNTTPGDKISFTGYTNRDKDGEITYIWDFGDGTKDIGKRVTHRFSTEGTYTVTLTTIDKNGNISTSTVNILIKDSGDNDGYDSDSSNDKNQFSLKMEVLDKLCSPDKQNCKKADFPLGEKIFDFIGIVGDTEETDFIYNWRFYDYKTGKEVVRNGKYIDNYNFLNTGKYRVYLKVESLKGQISEVYTDIKIENEDGSGADSENTKGLTSFITVDKLDTIPGDKVTFVGYTNKYKEQNVVYTWDFGDGKAGFGKTIVHTFSEDGIYTVTLKTTDEDGNISTSIVNINIKTSGGDDDNYQNDDSDKDTDLDGVPDRIDQCPEIKGSKENYGCPIFDEECKTDKDCKDGYFCDSDGYCKIKRFTLNCDYTGGDLIKGNVQCNSCPCNFDIDFNSTLRACDIVFPAITSPNFKDIYSKGNYFQIKK